MIAEQLRQAKADASEIRVIDLLSYSASHLAVNAFWLTELLRRGKFHVVAEQEHLELLSEAVGFDFRVKAFRRRMGWKLRREFAFLEAVIGWLGRPVFVMGMTGLQVFVMALLERLFPMSARRWLLVLHSEVEGVDRPRGLMKWFAGMAIRRLGFPRHARCVVLGEHIKANLGKAGLDSERIVSIEHPLPAVGATELTPTAEPGHHFAVIGLLRSDTKDLSVAAKIAAQKGVRVSMIGRIGPGYVPQPGVEQQVVAEHFDMEWMRERLRTVGLLLLCPAADGYRYTALGSIGDAITYGKMAAWLCHDALRAYEDAPIAVCARTPEELVVLARTVVPPTAERLGQWISEWNRRSSFQIRHLWDSISAAGCRESGAVKSGTEAN